MKKYTLPELPYPADGTRAAHLRAHHGVASRQASQGLRGRRQQGVRAASGGAQRGGFHPASQLSRRRLRSTSRATRCTASSGQNLSPKGGGEPKGELAEAIKRDFGSFAQFKQQLTKAAETCMGSGWGALVWEPPGGTPGHGADPRPSVANHPGQHAACWCSMPGNTPITCSIRMRRRSSSKPSGTSGTGRM